MFSANGIIPLATAGQSTIKIRLGKYIDAAKHKTRVADDPPTQKMIVAGHSGGQQERNVLGSAPRLMKNADLFMEMVATYRKHGWELRSALMQPQTLAALHEQEAQLLSKVPVKEAAFDAMWFSRPSYNRREAWELRLLAQTPYALFETFEEDETEEERDDVRLEMEARLRDYALGSPK